MRRGCSPSLTSTVALVGGASLDADSFAAIIAGGSR